MKAFAPVLAVLCLSVIQADSQTIAGGEQQEKATSIFLPVSLTSREDRVTFSASAGSIEFQVKSASHMSPTRPLLIIIDPSSYSMQQLHRLVTALVAALAAELPDRSHQKIHVGIPVFDGIMYEPPETAGTPQADIVSAIMRLVPVFDPGQRSDPGRALDLLPLLLQKAENDGGPVDCLWVGKDRPFEGEDGSYFSLGAERRILEACRRKGSLVHGHLEGAGNIGPICTATGGLTFKGEDEARTVIRQVLQARELGFVLEMQPKAALAFCGRFDLTIQAADPSGGFLPLRAPAAFWRLPEDAPAPEYESLRDALAWIGRSQKAFDSGDATTAARFIQNSVQLDPGNPDVFYFSAKYAAEAGEPDIAEAHLAKAMSFLPRTERVLVLYADVFRKLGRPAAALETLESLPPGTVTESAHFRLARARLLAAAARDDEAGKIFADLADLGQDSVQAQAEYGCLLLRLGKEADALAQIQGALVADPKNVTAMLCSAEVDSVHGRTTEALNTAMRAAALRPDDPDVALQIGKVHARSRRWDPALASLENAARIAPARADILLHLAEAEIESGQGREAILSMRRALAIDPLDTKAIRQISGLLSRAGAFTNAASVLEDSAARLTDKGPEFYREAAGLRERAGQYGQALLDYQASQASPAAQPSKTGRELSSHLDYLSFMVHGAVEYRGHTEKAAAGDGPGMLVPGGLAPLADILGIDPAALRDPGAAGKIFSLILATLPPAADANKLNPLQFEILDHLRTYERLLQFMKRNRISAASTDGTGKRQTYVLPLTGKAPSIGQTRKFLSFFGIKYSSRQQGKRESVFLDVSHQPERQPQQQLLRRLGIDIESRDIRELRFTIGDEILPSIVDADLIQTKILGLENSDPRKLLARFIKSPREMKFYLTLEQCAAPLRAPLLQSFGGRDLIPPEQVQESLGRFLELRDGRPALPGTPGHPAEASDSGSGQSLRGSAAVSGARLVYTYYTLAYASAAVQRYFIASSPDMEDLVDLIVPTDSARRSTADWNPEAARLVRMLAADDQGLILPIDPRFGPYLFPNRTDAGGSVLHVSLKELASLLQSATASSPGTSPGAGVSLIKYLKFLKDTRPDMVTDDVIKAIMRSPAESPVFLDLIWDLLAPPELLVPYLDYCREMSQARDKGWNINRTRTSQSIFFLISAFRRNQMIDMAAGHRLLKATLAGFRAFDELTFLNNVSAFLTGNLLPELGKSLHMPADAPELLPEALAGPVDRQTFLFNGSPLVYDAHAEQLQRIKSVLGLQHLAAITDVLQTVQLLTKSQGSRERDAGRLQSLAASIRKLPKLAVPPAASRNKAATSPQNPYADLTAELEASPNPKIIRDYAEWIQAVLSRAASALDTELGVALLGHCYAYYGSDRAAVLSYDPDFVRKHEFYPHKQPSEPGWSMSDLLADQTNGRGATIVGSLAGLQFPLNWLETAASAQSLGKWGQGKLLPAMLSGMRVVHAQLRTERAQEYVALSVRLGRELAVSCLSSTADPWCVRHLSALLSPLRADQVADLVGRRDPFAALELLSPSEMFFLGEAYLAEIGALPSRAGGHLCAYGSDLNAQAKAPEIMSPALQRLREIIPAEVATDLDAFQREVEQYGCTVRREMGFSEASIQLCEPYERLQESGPPDSLFDRIIDLKIRLAETGYAAGAPAAAAGLVGELALEYLVADPASTHVSSWNDLMKEIMLLNSGHHFAWMQELLNRGAFSFYSGKNE